MFDGRTYYIAGPMRNRPGYNDKVFAWYALDLRAFHPQTRFISPAEMDEDSGINFAQYPTGTEPLTNGDTLSDLMRRDLAAIDTCDGIIVLPGWEFSSGAAVEVAYARFLSLPVYDIKEFL